MVRLKQALEVFPVGDGSVYLLRDGYLAEFVIQDVDEPQLTLLRLLEQPRSVEELLASVAIPEPRLRGMLDDLREVGALDDAPAEDRALLSEEEWARYDRQLVYFSDVRPGRAAEVQGRLRDATVTIVGVGGLGTWAAAGLASAGVGRLVLVDDDVVDLSNLNRQVLYRRADIGRPKAEVAAEALAAFNPQLTLRPVTARVDGPARAAAVVDGADFVVETADWPPYRLSRWLDAACTPRGVPRIAAAQFPPRVRIGPTYIQVLDSIMRRAQEARVDVRVDPLVVGGVALTLVTVPRVAGRIVTTADGRLLRRVGSDNTPLCHEQLVRFVRRHLGLRPRLLARFAR
jgi:hypothetical protein